MIKPKFEQLLEEALKAIKYATVDFDKIVGITKREEPDVSHIQVAAEVARDASGKEHARITEVVKASKGYEKAQDVQPPMDPDMFSRAVELAEKELPRDQVIYLLGLRDATEMIGMMGRKSELHQAFPDKFPQPGYKHWIVPIHHGFGTSIRNMFRTNGFTEDYCGIANWDDYYEDVLNAVLDNYLQTINTTGN